jgi:membrane-associated phospholipid phosphatase
MAEPGQVSRQPRVRPSRISGWILLTVWFLESLAPAAQAASSEPILDIFENAWYETGDVLKSPWTGSTEGYLIAAGLAGAMVAAGIQDRVWYQAVQDHRQPWQDAVMPVITLGGEGWVHVGAYAGLYVFGGPRDQQVAAAALEGQLVTALFAVVLKAAFTATRPTPPDHPAERVWFTHDLSDQSFPSGHAMTAFCGAAILGHYYSVEWIAYPLAALVAYSRVYNQRHWPLDVIAGAGLGLLIGHTVVAFHERSGQPNSAVQVLLLPQDDGAKVVLACRF